jgi:hypothetical protein
MDAHEQREKHPKEDAAKSEPEIAQTDDLVIGVEKRAGEKTGNGRFRGCAAAVVGNHAECHYTPGGWRRKAGGRMGGEVNRQVARVERLVIGGTRELGAPAALCAMALSWRAWQQKDRASGKSGGIVYTPGIFAKSAEGIDSQ